MLAYQYLQSQLINMSPLYENLSVKTRGNSSFWDYAVYYFLAGCGNILSLVFTVSLPDSCLRRQEVSATVKLWFFYK